VGALGSLSAPPRGPSSMFSNIDGERFRIFSSDTYQEAFHWYFLALVMDATGSSALSPPRGSVVDVL
jgi:hypothetical protein